MGIAPDAHGATKACCHNQLSSIHVFEHNDSTAQRDLLLSRVLIPTISICLISVFVERISYNYAAGKYPDTPVCGVSEIGWGLCEKRFPSSINIS
jgi:hypothetical protein